MTVCTVHLVAATHAIQVVLYVSQLDPHHQLEALKADCQHPGPRCQVQQHEYSTSAPGP